MRGSIVGTLRQIVIAAFCFAVMTVTASVGAHAQCSTCVAALADGNSISYDGWTVSISGLSGNVPSTLELEIVTGSGETSSTSLVYELINSNGSSTLLTTTGSDLELKYDITVTSAPTRARSVSAAMSGADSNCGTSSHCKTDLGDITAAISAESKNISLSASSTSSKKVTFTPANPLEISYDVKLAPPSSGVTLSLSKLQTTVPEPATLAVLGPVVFALVKARKSKKRQHALKPL
jgi:hypothetical protein